MIQLMQDQFFVGFDRDSPCFIRYTQGFPVPGNLMEFITFRSGDCELGTALAGSQILARLASAKSKRFIRV